MVADKCIAGQARSRPAPRAYVPTYQISLVRLMMTHGGDMPGSPVGECGILSMSGGIPGQASAPVDRLHRCDILHSRRTLQIWGDADVYRQTVIFERGPISEAYLIVVWVN